MAKKIRLTIELDGNWVLKHRDDDALPVALIKEVLSKDDKLTVESSSLTTLTVLYEGQEGDCSGIKGSVISLFESRYPDAAAGEVLTFSTVEIDEEKAEEKAEETPEKDEEEKTEDAVAAIDDILSRISGRGVPKSAPIKANAAERIKGLVGAAEFKALTKELISISEEIKRTNTQEVFTNQCYLFSIGDGCGLSTYLSVLAQLISEYGLCDMVGGPVHEIKIRDWDDKDRSDPFAEAYRALDSGREDKLNVICFDICEWMDKLNDHYFKRFFREVERQSYKHIIVFRIPFVEKDVLMRIKYSLADLVSIKEVSFPPLSQEELKVCAEAELKRFNFTITKTAWKYFFVRLSEEKSDGKFYGINTVKKVVRELVYNKHISNSGKKEKSSQITLSDTKSLCFSADATNMSGLEELNSLVGLDDVKKKVNEILAQIDLAIKRDADRPCIHMRFVGNPGTGKTTVARILGKILKEKGILRIGAFFEYAGRDFCGRYVGETAPKTTGMCRDAYGSVLFIDEAYTLYRGDADSKDYGKEAIDTLIAEMENHRQDLLVIMAGYTADMDKLMEGNLGLKSRMPHTIEFPNFTRDELYNIFVAQMKGKFKCDKGMLEAVRKFFTELPDSVLQSKDFANARYVRNLYERTWAKAAMRCQLSGKTDVVLTREDFELASSDKEFATPIPKKTRIGF